LAHVSNLLISGWVEKENHVVEIGAGWLCCSVLPKKDLGIFKWFKEFYRCFQIIEAINIKSHSMHATCFIALRS
jgi:hypothetical protein